MIRPTRSTGVRASVVGTALTLGVLVLLAAPASADVLGRAGASPKATLTKLEARQFDHWWKGQTVGMSLALADIPVDQLREAAGQAWAAGIPRKSLQAILFSDTGQSVFARNAAGGEGQPSPYVAYFTNNPNQLADLGGYLVAHPEYAAGPGGTQDELFAMFSGLRESYLASLGLVEVNGLIVDPREPRLSPYLVATLFGPPEPLPQPAVALNVGS
jgi:hypothetical protein